ncbi:hypothetical protein Tco_0775617 [Tanacetum coccineum]
MEAHLALTQPTQVNKITTPCEICSGPHDTQNCMENPEQAFVEYASSRTDEAEGLVSEFMASQDVRLSKFEADFKQQQSEMANKIDTVLKAITDRIAGTLPSDTVKNLKLGIRTRVGKKKKKAYNVLPEGPIYEAILKKKITKKEDIGGNFKIPCSIGGLKHVHALVDQGSDVNVMPYSTYMKLADKRPAETDIRLSLASHSYIYPLRNSRRRVSREEEEGIDDEGEVTLYLMRRALEVLRKFHWMILGGRFNQLLHVSSLLLSKPGEY